MRCIAPVKSLFLVSLVVLFAVVASGCCCCFGGDWAQFAPPTTDDAGAMDEARRHFVDQTDELLAQLAVDAGPSAGGCTSGVADLAAGVAVAVISRGHAGADSAAQVQIDPLACFTRVVVLVVLTAGVWHAVSITADTLDGTSVSLGSDPGYLLQVDVAGGDSDFGSDEMF